MDLSRPWVTAKAVAAHFDISVMTVYRMIERGDLHGVRIGRSYRISSESVRKLMEGKQE